MRDEGISAMFSGLGAPLANVRWSWGGVCEDGTVVLRVWADQIADEQALLFDKHMDPSYSSPGINERLRHVELVRDGAPVWLVVCQVKDKNATPRIIEGFNCHSYFTARGITETEDGIFTKVMGRERI